MAENRTNYYTKLLASAARTASENGSDQANLYHRGVQVTIDMTAVTATGSVTLTIQGKDPLSGKYYDLLTSAAITTVSTVTLTLYPGVTETANVNESNPLPGEWRIKTTHANSVSMTYSVGANMLI